VLEKATQKDERERERERDAECGGLLMCVESRARSAVATGSALGDRSRRGVRDLYQVRGYKVLATQSTKRDPTTLPILLFHCGSAQPAVAPVRACSWSCTENAPACAQQQSASKRCS